MKTSSVSFPFLLGVLPLFLVSFLGHAQKPEERRVYFNKIAHPQTDTDLIDGLTYYTDILSYDTDAKDTLNMIYDYRMMAVAYHHLGDYYAAENTIIEAFQFMDTFPEKKTLQENRTGLYNQLGKVYRKLYDYDKALQTFDDALAYATQTTDSITIITNKGNIYTEHEQFPQAFETYTKALSKIQPQHPPSIRARILNNYGFASQKLYRNGLPYVQQALALREELQDLGGLYESYETLALLYKDLENLPEAKAYANKAYETALQVSPSYRLNALELLLDFDDNTYIENYRHLTDSLSKAQQIRENKYAAARYNVEQEREIAQAYKLEQEREKRQKVWFQAATLFVLLSGGFLFFYWRSKQRKKLQQEVQQTEHRISKKVHDEVANEVYGVMTRLQTQPPSKETVMDDLEAVYNRTRNIAKEFHPVDPEADFGEALSDLILGFKSDQVNVVTRNLQAVDWQRISHIKRVALYRVLQELLINMRKHSQASVAALRFEQEGKHLKVEYADNGVGTQLKHKSGLKNAESRIRSIKGSLTFDTTPRRGFKAHIMI